MKKRVILIGGFRKTKALAISLIKKGYYVTAINDNYEHCQALAEVDKLGVIQGDGSQPFVLEDANVYDADMAIALTGKDDDNLVICQLCKKKFQVKKTVTLIADYKKTDFFYRMGIDSVVCAITTITGIIEHQALLEEIATHIPVGEGNICISQVPIANKAPAVGKQLKDLNLPQGVIIGCVLRGHRSIIPAGNTRIHTGDVLVVISDHECEEAAMKELTGR